MKALLSLLMIASASFAHANEFCGRLVYIAVASGCDGCSGISSAELKDLKAKDDPKTKLDERRIRLTVNFNDGIQTILSYASGLDLESYSYAWGDNHDVLYNENVTVCISDY